MTLVNSSNGRSLSGILREKKKTSGVYLRITTGLILIACYFCVRMSSTDTLVTNDEPFWLGRSANFARAIRFGDFERTYQMAHPGVTVMWSGAIAFWLAEPDYFDIDPGNADYPFFIDGTLSEQGISPLDILNHARAVKLVFETLFFGLALFFIFRLSSMFVTFMSGLLIALDPFLVGFGPLLHVDSLFAMSLLSATLALSWASLTSSNRKPAAWRFLIAGSLAAAVVLTRMTGLIIAIPAAVAFLTLSPVSRSTPSLRLATAARAGLLWFSAMLGSMFLAWPALWVAPIETLKEILEWSFGAASGGHEHALFFNGTVLDQDPGLLFYPVTLAWRTTPITWVGLALFCILCTQPRFRQRVRPFIPALSLGVAFIIVMSFGAKKFDRYLLPVYPILSVGAALGFAGLVDLVHQTRSILSSFAAPLVLTAAVVLSGISLSQSGEYRLNYYNELLSSRTNPESVLQIGWGEGGSDVVAFLNSESDRLGRPVVVQTFSIPRESVPPPLKYFMYEGSSMTNRIQFRNVGLESAEDWNKTDYYVFNIQQTQRNMVPDYAYFEGQDPVFTVVENGVVIWEVFATGKHPFPGSVATSGVRGAAGNTASARLERQSRAALVRVLAVDLG